jgi:DNA repair protein RadC
MEEILILKESIGVVNSATDIFNKIKKIKIDFKQENFICFYLDSKNKVIKSEVIFKGGLNSCLIDPKVIFRNALKNNSNSLIIAHNHPSGDLKPSDEDLNIFEVLKKGGEILQIKVLDSIIFNKKEWYTLTNI